LNQTDSTRITLTSKFDWRWLRHGRRPWQVQWCNWAIGNRKWLCPSPWTKKWCVPQCTWASKHFFNWQMQEHPLTSIHTCSGRQEATSAPSEVSRFELATGSELSW